MQAASYGDPLVTLWVQDSPQDYRTLSCLEMGVCHNPPGPRRPGAVSPSWGKMESRSLRLTCCCRCCAEPWAKATRVSSGEVLMLKEVWERELLGAETTRPGGRRLSAGWSSLTMEIGTVRVDQGQESILRHRMILRGP